MDDDGLRRYAEARFGAAAVRAIAAYRTHRPDTTPGGIASAMLTVTRMLIVTTSRQTSSPAPQPAR